MWSISSKQKALKEYTYHMSNKLIPTLWIYAIQILLQPYFTHFILLFILFFFHHNTCTFRNFLTLFFSSVCISKGWMKKKSVYFDVYDLNVSILYIQLLVYSTPWVYVTDIPNRDKQINKRKHLTSGKQKCLHCLEIACWK